MLSGQEDYDADIDEQSPFDTLPVEGPSKEIGYNPKTSHYTTVPNHPGDIPEGTPQAILRQAGVTPAQFLGQGGHD